jgi:hypothetical protein
MSKESNVEIFINVGNHLIPEEDSKMNKGTKNLEKN